ncbi:glycosyl transferase family 1 [Longibacter salinarum]|uniref:Glycosyl transferase family 1 n=2 Tax=Longibacter salinarum TaxID=1850348 RepID=A0A2A8CZL9_9BACT|nr:glycosyl transferase family 1 [Longibacter salinarum]
MDNIGGMQRVAMKLHESLNLRDAESSAFDYDAVLLRSSWSWTHVKVLPFLLWAAWVIAKKARRDDVDVVLFSSMVTAALAVPLRPLLRRYGVRTAAIVHGLDVTTPFPPYQWFVPKVFDALDLVLPVSRATGEACTQRGLPDHKLQVVPNGIDPDRFRAPSDRATRRHLLTDALGPLPDDALLLCSVGRQVERKGFEWFIRNVMPDLPEDVHYWLAGDGPQTESIDAAIRENGLGDRVRLLGRISDADLARLYRGADLFVMPNVPVPGDMEGFGVVMLEAGQCGTPAIASRLEGIRDVITDGMNGHLVEPESPSAFRQTILRYHDAPDELAGFSRRARTHTQATFGWPAVAEQYIQVLRGLTDGHR